MFPHGITQNTICVIGIAPLTLVTTLEVDDIPTVKLAMTYDNGTKKKVKVPTHELESVEQVFYCFHEFLEAARKLSLDGAECFKFYRDTFRGHARSAWCWDFVI